MKNKKITLRYLPKRLTNKDKKNQAFMLNKSNQSMSKEYETERR